MADVHKLSERVIDVAERTSAVADAAKGRRFAEEECRHAGSCFLRPALASMPS